MLDKETAKKAIARLAELARGRHIDLHLTVYGGTVMMLAYNARPGTKDIDAIFRPRDEVIPIIEEVAREMNLESNWLNDDVKVWVTENEQGAKFFPGDSRNQPTPVGKTSFSEVYASNEGTRRAPTTSWAKRRLRRPRLLAPAYPNELGRRCG
jgi:hypothetical protein